MNKIVFWSIILLVVITAGMLTYSLPKGTEHKVEQNTQVPTGSTNTNQEVNNKESYKDFACDNIQRTITVEPGRAVVMFGFSGDLENNLNTLNKGGLLEVYKELERTTTTNTNLNISYTDSNGGSSSSIILMNPDSTFVINTLVLDKVNELSTKLQAYKDYSYEALALNPTEETTTITFTCNKTP